MIALSVSELEKLLRICEGELELLDMTVGFHKTVCMRIGQRSDANCANIVSSGQVISLVNDIRYLGILVVVCSLDETKNLSIML